MQDDTDLHHSRLVVISDVLAGQESVEWKRIRIAFGNKIEASLSGILLNSKVEIIVVHPMILDPEIARFSWPQKVSIREKGVFLEVWMSLDYDKWKASPLDLKLLMYEECIIRALGLIKERYVSSSELGVITAIIKSTGENFRELLRAQGME